jgi:hypothetical protein
MTSARSTSRGIATEIQVISHDDPVFCVESINFAFCARLLFVDDFYSQTPEEHLLPPSPTGTRKAAK